MRKDPSLSRSSRDKTQYARPGCIAAPKGHWPRRRKVCSAAARTGLPSIRTQRGHSANFVPDATRPAWNNRLSPRSKLFAKLRVSAASRARGALSTSSQGHCASMDTFGLYNAKNSGICWLCKDGFREKCSVMEGEEHWPLWIWHSKSPAVVLKSRYFPPRSWSAFNFNQK